MTYNDSDSPSTIILMVFIVLGIFANLFIAVTVRKYGAQTEAASLVFYMSLSQTFLVLAKFPFLFQQFKNGCIIGESLYWYTQIQNILISLYLVRSSRKLLSRILQSSEMDSASLRLDDRKKIALFALPLLPLIYPLSTRGFGHIHNWCATRISSHSGATSAFIFLTIITVLLLLCIYHVIGIWIFSRKLPENDFILFSSRTRNGPVAYALWFLLAILIRLGLGLVMGLVEMSPMTEYYWEYSITMLKPVTALGNLAIFLSEKNFLKVNNPSFDLAASLHRTRVYCK